jgi:hypothetical protein
MGGGRATLHLTSSFGDAALEPRLRVSAAGVEGGNVRAGGGVGVDGCFSCTTEREEAAEPVAEAEGEEPVFVGAGGSRYSEEEVEGTVTVTAGFEVDIAPLQCSALSCTRALL